MTDTPDLSPNDAISMMALTLEQAARALSALQPHMQHHWIQTAKVMQEIQACAEKWTAPAEPSELPAAPEQTADERVAHLEGMIEIGRLACGQLKATVDKSLTIIDTLAKGIDTFLSAYHANYSDARGMRPNAPLRDEIAALIRAKEAAKG